MSLKQKNYNPQGELIFFFFLNKTWCDNFGCVKSFEEEEFKWEYRMGVWNLRILIHIPCVVSGSEHLTDCLFCSKSSRGFTMCYIEMGERKREREKSRICGILLNILVGFDVTMLRGFRGAIRKKTLGDLKIVNIYSKENLINV